MKIPFLFPLIVTLLLISACSIPLQSDLPKAQIYRLSPSIDGDKLKRGRQKRHLYIPPVEVSPGLDSKKIVLMVNSLEQSHIAQSEWPEDLSRYLHAIIVDSFSASGAFTSVSNRLITKEYVYKLLITVSSFEIELPQAPHESPIAKVVLDAKLVDGKNQQLLWSERINASHRAKELRTSELVNALNHAVSDALNLLMQMVVER